MIAAGGLMLLRGLVIFKFYAYLAYVAVVPRATTEKVSVRNPGTAKILLLVPTVPSTNFKQCLPTGSTPLIYFDTKRNT